MLNSAPGKRDYPWHWSIVPWLAGQPADEASLGAGQAAVLGAFLRTLHRPAPPEAPRNPVRGCPLHSRKDAFGQRLASLGAHADLMSPALLTEWEAALSAPLDQVAGWIHGDLHPRNLLVADGQLCGVIDWGDLAVGDPATDLAAFWMLWADPNERQAGLEAYSRLSPATVQRARGWALHLGVTLLATGLHDHPRHAALGRQTLAESGLGAIPDLATKARSKWYDWVMTHSQPNPALRYGSFFRGVQLAAIAFSATELVAAWWFGSLTLVLASLITTTLGLHFAAATLLLFRVRLHTALSVAGFGTAMAAILFMLVLPEIITSLVLFPFTVIGMAMLGQSRRLLIGAVSLATVTTQLIIALSWLPRFFPPAPPLIKTLLMFVTPATVVLLLGLLFSYTWSSLGAALQASQASNRELAELRDGLADQVATRTAELEQALVQVQAQTEQQAQLLDETARQRQVISALSVPVLPVSTDALVVPLVGSLDPERLDLLRQRTLAAIEQRRSRYLLLDLTGIELLDEHLATGLLTLTKAVRLLGTRPIVIGIRPEVAETMIALNYEVGDLTSLRDLASALELIQRKESHQWLLES